MNEYYNQNLQISQESAQLLGVISKWTRFLSILGFIVIIILALSVLAAATLISSVNYYEMTQGYFPYNPGSVSWPYVTFYVIMLVIYTIPVYYLFRFSAKTKDALDTGNSLHLTDAIRFLKNHYTIIGIFTIVWIILLIISTIYLIIEM